MEIILVGSEEDLASKNIRDRLIEGYDFDKIKDKFEGNDVFKSKINGNDVYVVLIKDGLIYSENLDKRVIDSKIVNKIDLIVFLSRHQSKEDTPAFTVHTIGNWYKAEYGGKNKELCGASAVFIKEFFIELNENAREGYQHTLEATHHGPFIESPAAFIEIGSTEKEWVDEENGRVIANTLMKTLKKYDERDNWISSILLGGGHYAQAGTKTLLRTNYAIGHICPKYNLKYLNEDILMQAISKTIPKIKIILLDWKGLGTYKNKIIEILDKLGIKYERIQNILK